MLGERSTTKLHLQLGYHEEKRACSKISKVLHLHPACSWSGTFLCPRGVPPFEFKVNTLDSRAPISWTL